METYLAYFDILGFKVFIDNNDDEAIDLRFEHLFRDSQSSLVDRKFIMHTNGGMVPDLANSKTNCLHISDSIIFWSNDSTEESFKTMIKVCNHFLSCCCVLQTFPVRGCLVKGALTYDPFIIASRNNSYFRNSSLYGKALINAYIKAEDQDWIGCYVDKSALDGLSPDLLSALKSMNSLVEYDVPLKNGTSTNELTIKLYSDQLDNVNEDDLRSLFSRDMNGEPLSDSVERKLQNTIDYFNYIKKIDNKT